MEAPKEERVDIVYLFSQGLSRWKDHEIVFSLRSIEKFVSSFDKVWIIGNALSFPLFSLGPLSARRRFHRSPYRASIDFTIQTLKSLAAPTLSFEVRAPILIYKQKLSSALAKVDWKREPGILWRSIYGNLSGLRPTLLKHDVKIYRHFPLARVNHYLQTLPFVSSDRHIHPALSSFLHERFPKRSKFEKTNKRRRSP